MGRSARSDAIQALGFAAFRLSMLGLSFVTSLLIARWLGAYEFGLYAAGAALIPLIMALGMGGLDQLALRGDVSISSLRSLLGYWATVLLVVGGIVCLLIPGLEAASRIVALVILISATAETARQWWLLQPQIAGELHVRARREALIRISAAAGLVTAVLIWRSPIGAASGQAFVSVLLLMAATRTARTAARATWREFVAALRKGRLFAMSGAAYVTYLSVSGVFLAAMAPPEEAGMFRIAFGFFQIAIAVPIALNNEAFRPRLYALAQDHQGVMRLRKQFARLNIAAAVIICIATGALVTFGVPVLLGPEFQGSALPGLVLAAAIPMHFFNSYHGNLLVAQQRVRLVITLQVAGIAGVCILAVFLVPHFAAVGAAGSILGVELLLTMGYGLASTIARKRA